MNHLEMMRLAEKVALQSVCKRAQVGAVVVSSFGAYQSLGWNRVAGDIDGEECCEDEDGKTRPDVIHAEMVAIHKSAYIFAIRGATLYVTRQPCINCARAIVNAGIKTVYYRDADDKTDGIEHLLAHGVTVDSRWIKWQMRAQTLERVQGTWAERNACASCPQNGDGVCCGGVR